MHLKIKSSVKVILLTLFYLMSIYGYSANSTQQDQEEYIEISVFLNVPKIGGTEVSALIKDKDILLSITDLFGFLKIKAEVSPGFDKIEGFFINEKSKYVIDRVNNTIEYNKKVYTLKPQDLVRSETQLYLKLNFLGEIFGLECSFNFRSLSVTLNTAVELPIIKEMRQEQMRKNIRQISGEIEADTTIGRSYPFFRFGAVDWNVSSSQEIGGATSSRIGMNIGTALAAGEANLSLNYTPGSSLNSREQYYSWRYANNNHKIVRQALVGKIGANSISTLSSSIIGFQISNTPTTYRKSYSTYTLSDVTEPGWTVELYVNNVLIDYKKADASGFFSFEVPLIYGSTSVRLQYYGLWGEVRSEEKEFNIPFNFLPKGTVEYKIAGGVLEDSTNAKFSRFNVDYGATNFLTFGAGVEYFSLLENGGFIPFINSSLRLGPNLLLSTEYAHQVKLRSNLNYRLFSNIQLELDYTRYNKDQTTIRTSYLEERKAALTFPIRLGNLSFFARLSYDNNISQNYTYNAADLMISGSMAGVNTNLSTKAISYGSNKTDIQSTLNLSLRLPFGFVLNPQVQYNYTNNQFISAKGKLDKQLRRNGFLTISFEQNFLSNTNSIEAGLRFDLSFGKFGVSARRSGDKYSFSESASGSILTDFKSKYISANVRGNVGRGGLLVLPFLDINGNGVRDEGEPKAFGMDLRMNGGRIEFSEKDTLIRVFELEPYADYLITLNGDRLDNISWVIQNKTVKVSIDPNQFKHIEVPVAVVGEAAGMVYLKSGKKIKGLGRIIVNYFRNGTKLVASVLTEEDGYFSYMGLLPGKYVAMLDKNQLSRVGMESKDYTFEFEIEEGIDGTYLDNIEFLLEKIGGEAPEEEAPESQPKSKTIIYSEKRSELAANDTSQITETLYKVQLFALSTNEKIYEKLLPILTKFQKIEIRETHATDSLYRYSIGSFKKRTEAAKALLTLRLSGVKGAMVFEYNAAKEKEITTRVISYIPKHNE